MILKIWNTIKTEPSLQYLLIILALLVVFLAS